MGAVAATAHTQRVCDKRTRPKACAKRSLRATEWGAAAATAHIAHEKKEAAMKQRFTKKTKLHFNNIPTTSHIGDSPSSGTPRDVPESPQGTHGRPKGAPRTPKDLKGPSRERKILKKSKKQREVNPIMYFLLIFDDFSSFFGPLKVPLGPLGVLGGPWGALGSPVGPLRTLGDVPGGP